MFPDNIIGMKSQVTIVQCAHHHGDCQILALVSSPSLHPVQTGSNFSTLFLLHILILALTIEATFRRDGIAIGHFLIFSRRCSISSNDWSNS